MCHHIDSHVRGLLCFFYQIYVPFFKDLFKKSLPDSLYTISSIIYLNTYSQWFHTPMLCSHIVSLSGSLQIDADDWKSNLSVIRLFGVAAFLTYSKLEANENFPKKKKPDRKKFRNLTSNPSTKPPFSGSGLSPPLPATYIDRGSRLNTTVY